MKLAATMRMFCESAGTQSIEPGAYEDERIKKYLKRKQSKLDKQRRAVAPYPEDQRIRAAKKEVGHWSPAPEDVESLNRKSYKVGMKPGKKRKVTLHTTPGAVPLEDQIGSAGMIHIRPHKAKHGLSHHIHEKQHHEDLKHLKEMAKGKR